MLDEIQLIEKYEYILRGILNYYSFSDNYSNLHQILYILKYSLICTIARKRRLNTAKVIKKYGKQFTIKLSNGKSRTLAFPTTLKKNLSNSFKIKTHLKESEKDPLEIVR